MLPLFTKDSIGDRVTFQLKVTPRTHQGQVSRWLYSGTNVLLAIAFNLLWLYASYKNRLLDPKADFHSVQAITRQYRFGPLLYLITFAFAWLSASVSVILILLLAVFYALPGRPLRTVPEKIEMKGDEVEEQKEG